MMMNISVIIPAFNEEKYIAACLESIMTAAPDALLEIIVVDNASTDRTAEIARQFPRVKVIHEPRKGTGWARQAGVEVAAGDLLAYIDADCRLPSDWFSKVHSAFASDDQLIALSGPYKFYDSGKFISVIASLYWLIASFVAHIVGFMATGGNFVVKRDALVATGGFNTSISFFGDDTNIVRRLAQCGRTKFDRSIFSWTSSRRLREHGFLRTGILYILNFFSEAFLGQPATKMASDVR